MFGYTPRMEIASMPGGSRARGNDEQQQQTLVQ
jgi:hypothetical protein